MNPAKYIIYGPKQKEIFDERRLFASVTHICVAAGNTPEQAKQTASLVTDAVITQIANLKSLSSGELREKTATTLHQYNPDAAYIYLHHRVIW